MIELPPVVCVPEAPFLNVPDHVERRPARTKNPMARTSNRFGLSMLATIVQEHVDRAEASADGNNT